MEDWKKKLKLLKSDTNLREIYRTYKEKCVPNLLEFSKIKELVDGELTRRLGFRKGFRRKKRSEIGKQEGYLGKLEWEKTQIFYRFFFDKPHFRVEAMAVHSVSTLKGILYFIVSPDRKGLMHAIYAHLFDRIIQRSFKRKVTRGEAMLFFVDSMIKGALVVRNKESGSVSSFMSAGLILGASLEVSNDLVLQTHQTFINVDMMTKEQDFLLRELAHCRVPENYEIVHLIR